MVLSYTISSDVGESSVMIQTSHPRKTETVIRLYKFDNVEEALHRAVLSDISYFVC